MAVLSGTARMAAASCAPPVPATENASRAIAVVSGTVTSIDGAVMTVRVAQVLKGDVHTPLRVFVGPSRGAGATSVDYAATVGSEHVLYLTRGSDGALETNACAGSHAGALTGEEQSVFGPGVAPSQDSDTASVAWVAVALAILALVAFTVGGRAIARKKSP